MTPTLKKQCDLVVICAKKLELDAVLNHLNSVEYVDVEGRRCFVGKVPANSGMEFNIVALGLFDMGNIAAALAVPFVLKNWDPGIVSLTGITGGLKDEKEGFCLGDVLVAEQLIDYESGAVTTSGLEHRYQAFRPGFSLVRVAKELNQEKWVHKIKERRPDGTSGRVFPQAHFGVMASGEKVIKDGLFFDEMKKVWPKLIGTEMESVGIARAMYEYSKTDCFIIVKSISDWANSKKSDDWQPYAADSAAAFLIELLTNRPRKGPNALKPISDPSKYTGKVKLCMFRRLGNDWEDLAVYFSIPPYHLNRFKTGSESLEIWNWLEQRGQLWKWEDGIRAIDREDVFEACNE